MFTEGERTENVYLTHWRRKNRFSVAVQIAKFHGVPLSLVRKAIEARATNKREARKNRGDAHDEIWCVFDVDEHPDLEEAIALAKSHDIMVAVSNPCIELWFLLHYEDQTGHIDRHSAQSAFAKRANSAGKAPREAVLETMDDSYDVAKSRARRLEQKHIGDETPAPGNPSSGLWRLTDSITRAKP